MTNKEEVKKRLLGFTIERVEQFLAENPALEFYAFAYDCNAEYAEVNLCFNTEADFQATLKSYQSGDYAKYYQTEEDINDLRYNTGDWEFQCFDTIYVLSDEELQDIFDTLYPENKKVEDYTLWNEFVESLMNLFCEVIVDFTKTDTYQKIPKTKDFIAYCIDHDEDIETAFERFEKMSGVKLK